MNAEPGWTLKAKSIHKWVGVTCTVFSVVVGVASVIAAANNADGSFKNPVLAAITFGVLWSLFSLLGVYLWLFSQKYRLEVSSDAIEQTGVFTQKRIAFRDITKTIWRNRPVGGSVKFKSIDSHLSIDFGTLNTDDRDELIDFFRSTFPSQHQSGWDEFLLNPEKIKERSSVSPVGRAIIFYLFSVTFIACWFLGLGPANLMGAVINGAFATYLLTRNARTAQRLNSK